MCASGLFGECVAVHSPASSWSSWHGQETMTAVALPLEADLDGPCVIDASRLIEPLVRRRWIDSR
jgi:hypothetical protein